MKYPWKEPFYEDEGPYHKFVTELACPKTPEHPLPENLFVIGSAFSREAVFDSLRVKFSPLSPGFYAGRNAGREFRTAIWKDAPVEDDWVYFIASSSPIAEVVKNGGWTIRWDSSSEIWRMDPPKKEEAEPPPFQTPLPITRIDTRIIWDQDDAPQKE